jgi:hypothetical protein
MIYAIRNDGNTTFYYMHTHSPSPSTVGYLIVFSLCICTFGVYRYGKVPVYKAFQHSGFLGLNGTGQRSGGVRYMKWHELGCYSWTGHYLIEWEGIALTLREKPVNLGWIFCISISAHLLLFV